MSIWEQITALFRQAEESSPSAPAVHELITRDEEELAAYEQWKRTLSRHRLMDWLTDQYAVARGKGRQDEAIGFLDTPSTKGFVIHFHRVQYSPEEINHFFHYLQEQILALDYRSDISDRRIFSRKDWVETQERHYLKPRNTYEEGQLLNQGFGNITIELERRNDRPHNLRLRATAYQDALYAPSGSFGGLMMALADDADRH